MVLSVILVSSAAVLRAPVRTDALLRPIRARATRITGAFTEADYLADPADISAVALPAFAQRDVFLHFHGRGGPDREDADLKARVLAQDKAAGLDRFVHVFVWRDWLEAATAERISFTGQAIGRKLGLALAATHQHGCRSVLAKGLLQRRSIGLLALFRNHI